MDEIIDSKWQAQHRDFTWVPGSKVYEKFQSFFEGLDVRGHSQLAASLSQRVTPQLCEKYPLLLLVLRNLAQDPPNTKLPIFARPNEPSWQEIVDEDPLEGEHWQQQHFSQSSEDESDQMATPPPIIADPQLIPPKSQLVFPDLPPSLNTRQLVQEIKYRLLGYSALLPYKTQLTCEMLSNVLTEVEQLKSILDAIRNRCDHPFAGYAFESLRDTLYAQINSVSGVPADSLLALMLYLKKLLLPWAFVQQLPLDYIEMLDHLYTHEFFTSITRPFAAQVSLWTSTGQLGPLISIYNPTLAELIDDKLELKMPHFVNTRAVTDAGRYAHIASILGTSCEFKPLVMDYTLEHQILVLENRNRKILMDTLVPLLLDEWKRVSRVYLVQDTRLVEFVLACVDQQASFTVDNETQVASILKTCWFHHEFSLVKLVPRFQFENSLVELLLPIKQLEKQWIETVLAIADNELAPSHSTRQLALECQVYNQAAVKSISQDIKSMSMVKPLVMPERDPGGASSAQWGTL